MFWQTYFLVFFLRFWILKYKKIIENKIISWRYFSRGFCLSFFYLKKSCFCKIFRCFLQGRNAKKIPFCSETANENKQFKYTNETWISNSYLISQSWSIFKTEKTLKCGHTLVFYYLTQTYAFLWSYVHFRTMKHLFLTF